MRPLEEYNHKRDFKKTPEPSGKKLKKKSKKLSFVVQEHHASHLHYDFRLELDGVLKSWAVPKGPSPDPKEKRLAMQVEDHPLGYGTFEGEIPEDEYGGGEVLIWDHGNWEPENDPHAGLKKGHLDFTLKGTRMKGRWTLIRTGGFSKKPSWLLFKRSDEYAGIDKLFHPIKDYGSKKERGTHIPVTKMTKKKANSKNKIKLGFIEPQLAQLVDAPPKGDEWVHEIKFDGYRIQAQIDGKKVKLFTRSGQDWTHKYEMIANQVKKLNLKSGIIDGEIVALDEKGRSDFGLLQMAMRGKKNNHLKYYVFDLMAYEGEDLREEPLTERKKILKSIINKAAPNILYSEHLEVEGKKLLGASCEQDLEGIVSKLKDGEYSSGRNRVWMKSKCTQRQEFVIGGYSDPQGARDHFGSLLLGIYEDGEFRYVGRCGTGFDGKTLQIVRNKLKKLETKKSPFTLKSPKERDVHFVKPNLVAEISFSNWTRDEILRVPVFHGLREDKDPKDIIREKPAAAKSDEKPEKKIKARTKTSRTSLAEPDEKIDTALTHPDKVLYPKEKVTKKDVADYYQTVAPLLLPHIADRPLSLKRCPDGTGKTCFYQKHFTPAQRGKGADPVVHEIMIQEHSGKKGYASVDSVEGLVALVQMGGFEFHAWGCKQPDIEHPDQIVMDFDPGPNVTFAEVKKAAMELKTTLDQLNLKSFLKVTGGKGLHVHIPIEPIYSWDDVKDFTRTLAQHMEENHPDRYTSTLSKSARNGKIFIDYLRNGRSATAVVPYSLRTRETSSVALPISWAELKTLRDPAGFTLKKTLAYLKKRKSDPWEEAEGLEQKISLLKSSP